MQFCINLWLAYGLVFFPNKFFSKISISVPQVNGIGNLVLVPILKSRPSSSPKFYHRELEPMVLTHQTGYPPNTEQVLHQYIQSAPLQKRQKWLLMEFHGGENLSCLKELHLFDKLQDLLKLQPIFYGSFMRFGH